MFIRAKTISLRIAVAVFFAMSIACQMMDFDAVVCLKRALIAAVAAYILSNIIVKALNSLLLDAVINKRLKEEIKSRNAE